MDPYTGAHLDHFQILSLTDNLEPVFEGGVGRRAKKRARGVPQAALLGGDNWAGHKRGAKEESGAESQARTFGFDTNL